VIWGENGKDEKEENMKLKNKNRTDHKNKS
jgi:hypothetical protein